MEFPSAELEDYEWDRWGRNRRQGWPAGPGQADWAQGPAIRRWSVGDAPCLSRNGAPKLGTLKGCPSVQPPPTRCFQTWEEAVAVRPLPVAPHHPLAAPPPPRPKCQGAINGDCMRGQAGGHFQAVIPGQQRSKSDWMPTEL